MDSLVFLIDVDNTLLNNDQIKIEIKNSLIQTLGTEEAEHFWQHHDSFREYAHLVDFPTITRQYCQEKDAATCSLKVTSIFDSIEFEHALYPHALEVIAHFKQFGGVYIFSEGDMVYQKQKIEKGGLAAACSGVLLYEHKLNHLPEIQSQFLGNTLIIIDDRDDKLADIKKQIPNCITVVVCQGHYAGADCPIHHSADFFVSSLQELLTFTKEKFISKIHS